VGYYLAMKGWEHNAYSPVSPSPTQDNMKKEKEKKVDKNRDSDLPEDEI